MSWISGELILGVTGVLFAVVAALGTMPSAALAAPMRLLYLSIGAFSVGAAFVLGALGGMTYPPFLWLLPLVPCTIAAVMLTDARRHGRRAAASEPVTASALSTALAPEVAARACDPGAAPSDLARIAFSHPQARALVAANPATPANLLEWLAAVGDDAVVQSIVQRRHATEGR